MVAPHDGLARHSHGRGRPRTKATAAGLVRRNLLVDTHALEQLCILGQFRWHLSYLAYYCLHLLAPLRVLLPERRADA